MGNNYEKISKTGSIAYRHVVRANGRAIMLRKSSTIGTTKHEYIHRDHLGSVTALTRETDGSVIERYSYDAWGKRRSATNWTSAVTTAYEPRGYTGHEHLDDIGTIHMNGRVYDPKLGRFLQADPFIDGTTNTQGYNRYSYVANNPLSYTDPTGYLKFRELVGAIVGTVLAVYCIPCTATWYGAFAAGAAAGAAGAAANGGNILQGALMGGVSAAAFYGAAQAFQGTTAATGTNTIRAGANSYLSPTEFAQLAAAQASVGGVMAELQGGKFGHGFVSAGLVKLSTPGILALDNVAAESIASGIVGGTASELTGGKFANGAATGTFLYAFNAGSSRLKGILSTVSESRRVLKNARARGVSRAWKMEQDLVKATGRGTREWTEVELKLLSAGKRVPGFNGYHINSAAANSIKMAESPSNIEFLTRGQHFAKHGYNWQNVTQGSLIDRALSIGVTVFGAMEVFDPISITERTQADMGNPYGIPAEM